MLAAGLIALTSWILLICALAAAAVMGGLVTLVSFISPFRAERQLARERFDDGELIEIFVDTPIEVCEQRDRKGLYAKARAGIIKEFTGISDPYEVPEFPELRVDTTGLSPMEAAQEIFLYLLREGYLDTANGTLEPCQ